VCTIAKIVVEILVVGKASNRRWGKVVPPLKAINGLELAGYRSGTWMSFDQIAFMGMFEISAYS
jgi:hypothetical protein